MANSASDAPEYEPIAIVGIGCRLPGANSPLEFWRLLRSGEAQMQPMPSGEENERWSHEHFYDPSPSSQGKVTHETVCLMDQVHRFDADFFKLNPKEAAEMDPQHR